MRIERELVRHPHSSLRFLRFEAAGFGGRRHRHGHYELTWIERGAGIRYVGDDARPFIDGDAVTIADIFAFPWIDLANEGNIDIAAYPAVQEWYRRMLAQPGCATQYTLMPTEDRPAADWD